MDLSHAISGKPELSPKPRIPGPLQLTSMPSPGVLAGRTSAYVSKTLSPPVKVQVCHRGSFFPPSFPRSPKPLIGGGFQENNQNGGTKLSSEVAEMRNCPRDSMVRSSGKTGPQTNRGSRGSRRSFTTDDSDIGLYKKPSFQPELSPLPDPFKPKPPVVRRVKASDVGSRVDMFERMTCVRSGSFSGSFSKEKPAVRPAVRESQNVAAKPKPPVKPRISNFSQDLKPTSTSKPLAVLEENSIRETEEKVPTPTSDLPVSSKVKPQLPPNKPGRSNASEKKINVLPENEIEDQETNSNSGDDCSSDGNESEDENLRQNNSESHVHEAGKEISPIDKAKKVAEELLKTEEAYVGRLKLLDQVFHMEIMNENRDDHFLPDDIIPQMFPSIKSILLFHNDFLLPQLHSCMAEWGSCVPRIGQVLKKFAPFLKMYTDYVRNFENATNLIVSWTQRSPRFAGCLDEIQRRPECGSLTLQHHLLEPIQRVPRYELLLRDYIKNLPEDSEDRIHASEALELVTLAAQHSNAEMRRIEKFRKLLDVNDALGGALDLVNPTRELIKEGKITKISARDGDHSERHLFLFNDLLVVSQSLPLKQLGLRQQQYIVKSELDIRGMQVLEGSNLETAHTFIIKSKQKSIEFCGSTQELKEEWQRALWSTISDYTRKEYSRNADCNLLIEFQEKELGKRAPTWVKDQETTMCMNCGERFGTFKRRHHCRCCGKVVCSKCSAYKAKLSYNHSRELRVCVNCSTALGLQQAKVSDEKGALNRARAVLKTSATDPSVLNGYLNMSSNKKNWNRKFFAIHSNFVLYSFKAHQDVIAHTSLPLPGYKVVCMEKSEDIQMKDFVFCISQEQLGKFYYFQADDETQRKRWTEVLLCVIIAELPSSTSSCLMTKSESPSSVHSTMTAEPTCDTIMEQREEDESSSE